MQPDYFPASKCVGLFSTTHWVALHSGYISKQSGLNQYTGGNERLFDGKTKCHSSKVLLALKLSPRRMNKHQGIDGQGLKEDGYQKAYPDWKKDLDGLTLGCISPQETIHRLD